MSRELDYFTEFLQNPSAVSLGEFYRMAREWADYIAEHKEDFNYLEDEEWKEVRERFNAEFHVRQEVKDLVDAKWKIVANELDRAEELDDDYLLRLLGMQLDMIKEHPDYFNIPAEAVASVEKEGQKFEKSVEKAKISEEKYRISKQKLENSSIALDDALMKVEDETGKKPHVFSYKGKQGNKGH